LDLETTGSNVYLAWSDRPFETACDINLQCNDILFLRSTDNGAHFGSTKNLSNNDGDSNNPQMDLHGSNVNYKELGESNNISSELRKSCPDGIDIYFDNVGGEHLESAIDNMKVFGRIVLCGMISQYNATSMPAGHPISF
jgi:threonine dehydrogenase-like Zn-dependent dehydrogenase